MTTREAFASAGGIIRPIGITHAFIGTLEDGEDTSLVRPSDWRAIHVGDYVSGPPGSGQIIIPGLAGDPDRVPPSPSAYDDEFNTYSGWTTLGSLSTVNVTDFPSHLHLTKADTGTAVNGIYKAAPSMPFTVTAKFSDYLTFGNYYWVSILLTESAPGKLFTWGAVYTGGFYVNYSIWTNRTTRSATYGDTNVSMIPKYFRLVVTSSSSIACLFSENGYIWRQVHTGLNSTFTVANVGLSIHQWSGGVANMDATIDWIRFT